jgi:hypothetical protein
MWHNATLAPRSASSVGACWGSFGGRNTWSTTESRTLESKPCRDVDISLKRVRQGEWDNSRPFNQRSRHHKRRGKQIRVMHMTRGARPCARHHRRRRNGDTVLRERERISNEQQRFGIIAFFMSSNADRIADCDNPSSVEFKSLSPVMIS